MTVVTDICPLCGKPMPNDLLSMHVEQSHPGEELPTPELSPEEFAKSESLDEAFFGLVEQLDFDPRLMADVNVTLLDDVELSRRYGDVRQQLLARGEMMQPTTDIGRELHSQRAAYIIEMRKRGLK